ncbi:MAG: Calx-beta domain-containing protein, partial [Candidatus Rokuibacteriota bacterium]
MAGSGNDGLLDKIIFPACISTAVSVGATTDGSGGVPADLVAGFSNSAAFLSLLAPGYLINSSVPGGGFGAAQGTSMATPHVAGAWAVAKQANPGASVSDVLASFQNTGRLITDVNDVVTPRIAATMLQFSAPTYSVVETGGNAIITVTRTGSMLGPNLAPLTIDYATSAGTAIPGQDYTETSGTLEFHQGETSKTFTVPVNDNTVDNTPKTVNLTLTSPGGGALLGVRDVAVLTIGDNDVPGTIQFSSATYSANENAGTVTITVTRSGGNASPTTVQYATSDGTGHAGEDYELATGTLTFDATGPGATTQTFAVTILNNGLPDGNRTVNLTLDNQSSGATLGIKKTSILTIADEEIALQFSQASYSVKESAGSATITVTRTGPKEPQVEATYTVLGGSATQGVDYGGIYTGPLVFAANETTKTFKVTILNDTLTEGAETVLLRLSDPTGAILGNRPTAALTILDNDLAGSFKFSAASYSVNEGTPILTVTVTRTGGTGSGVSVAYLVDPDDPGTAAESVDFTLPDPNTLDFAASVKSRTFTITISPDADAEPDETIRLKLQDPVSGATIGLATVTIVDDDRQGTFQFSAASYSVNEASPSAVLTVTRSGSTAGAASVEFEDISATGGTCGVGGADYVATTFTLQAGLVSQTVPVAICQDGDLEAPPQTFKARLTNLPAGFALGANGETTVAIVDATVQFGASQYVVGEGATSVTLLVTRTGSTATPASVSYSTTPGSAAEASGACSTGFDYRRILGGTIAFAAGQPTKTISIPLCKDSAAGEGDETFSVTLASPSGLALGSPATAEVVIQEDDGIFRLTAFQYSAKEGSANVPIVVQRTGSVGGPASVE